MKNADPNSFAWHTIVFETSNLKSALAALKKAGVKIVNKRPTKSAAGNYIAFEDPFGNVSELMEVAGAG